MKKDYNWTDKEWAEYLGIAPRTARGYFKNGIIHGARKDSRGEWHATGNGLSRYLTHQNMARHCGWKLDEDGDYIDPRLSKEMKEAFKSLIDSRKPLTLRMSRMRRVASAYKCAVNQQPIEPGKLDEVEEAFRWESLSPAPLKVAPELEAYLPTDKETKFIRAFYKNGLLERVELLVAMVSAINLDGKAVSKRLPSAYKEWQIIRGKRPTGKLIVTGKPDSPEGTRLEVATKPNKSSYRQFKTLIQRYGRSTLLKEAQSLHPDTSDIFELHKDLQYNEGAAHWHIKAQDAMDS